MIEAINASISSAPVLRPIAEEASSSQSSNPVRIQKAVIEAPYLSPHVRLAPNSKPVFVVRDINTGAQIKQFPTEAQIRAYQKAGEARTVAAAQTMDGQTKEISPEEAKIMIKSSVQYKEERAAVQFKEAAPLPGTQTNNTPDQAPAVVPGKVSVDQQA